MSTAFDAAFGANGAAAPEAENQAAESPAERGPPGPQDAGEGARAPEEAPAPPPAQPGDDNGRFATAEAPKDADAGARTPLSASQPPLSEKEVVGFYKAMQAEREKRQAIQRELDEARRQMPPTPQGQVPIEHQLTAQLRQQTLTVSRRFAERAYGADKVAELHEWASAKCDADPLFNQRMAMSDDPYEEAKRAFDGETIVAKVTPDRLAAFEAWEAEQGRRDAGGTGSQSPSTQAPVPPKSLATASGTGDAGRPHVPTGAGSAYQSLFQR